MPDHTEPAAAPVSHHNENISRPDDPADTLSLLTGTAGKFWCGDDGEECSRNSTEKSSLSETYPTCQSNGQHCTDETDVSSTRDQQSSSHDQNSNPMTIQPQELNQSAQGSLSNRPTLNCDQNLMDRLTRENCDQNSAWFPHPCGTQQHQLSISTLQNPSHGATCHRPHGASSKHSYYDCCIHVAVPSLLEHWLDGDLQQVPPPSRPPPSPLHTAVRLPNPTPWLRQLLSAGWDPNMRNTEDQTPLHVLLSVDCRDNPENVVESVTVLLESGADVLSVDKTGNTPLTSVRQLLDNQLYSLGTEVGALLIRRGSQVNQVTNTGACLLSYSVSHLDSSLALTRLLLNQGSSVWSQSVLASLLRSLMVRQNIDEASGTLSCLGQMMGQSPSRMRRHVISCMMREGRVHRLTGNLLQQVKSVLAVYWTVPTRLKQLCWREIRRAVGVKRLGQGGVTDLKLPLPLKHYLSMDSVDIGVKKVKNSAVRNSNNSVDIVNNTQQKPKTEDETEMKSKLIEDRLSYKIRMDLLSNSKTI